MIFFADENDENIRLDNFLVSVTSDMTRQRKY